MDVEREGKGAMREEHIIEGWVWSKSVIGMNGNSPMKLPCMINIH